MAPVPRQRTSVLALLDWLREQPAFSRVILKDLAQEDGQVQVFVIFSRKFGRVFESLARAELDQGAGGLDEQRRLLLLDLLEKTLSDGPELLDVELRHEDYALEETEDFGSVADVYAIPSAVFITFKLKKKTRQKKGAKTSTANDPAADAGARGYVIRAVVAPDAVADQELRADFEPDWSCWMPNPAKQREVKRLLKAVAKTLAGGRPPWRLLAAKLNGQGHRTLTGKKFTEANVWRVVLAAEQMRGNKRPKI